MSEPMVVVPYSREFPFPAEDCFAWLTDYQDDDPHRTTAVVTGRQVLERTSERVVFIAETDVLGAKVRGRAEVRLFPAELRYEARSLEGDGGAILYTYQLTRLAPDRTRLDIHYGTRVRRFSRRLKIRLARPMIRRRLHAMWEGFAVAMANDLRAVK